MAKGFFHGSQLAQSTAPLGTVAKCGACGLHKACTSPKMAPSGSGKRGILVVGEAPGTEDDKQGRHWAGKAGALLRETLAGVGIVLERDCWLTNAIICTPDGTSPTDDQVTYCAPNLAATIKALNPITIIPLGGVANRAVLKTLWRDEDIGGINTWAGWRIPAQRINTWVCPTFDPAWVLRKEKQPVVKLWWQRHLAAAVDMEARPWATVPDYNSEIEIITDSDRAAAILSQMVCKGGPVAFDYETNMLKPDSHVAKIVSCSVCWRGRKTIAYPWAGAAIAATQALLRSPQPKIAANCFSGDTKLLTREYGVVPFTQVVGKLVTVLNHEGRWVPARIHSFGFRKLKSVSFARRNYINTVRTTKDHEWLTPDGEVLQSHELRPHGKRGYEKGKWKPAHQVPYGKAPKPVPVPNDKEYIAGVVHGIIYGDGSASNISTKNKPHRYRVRLCGEKKELISYLQQMNCSTTCPPSSEGDPVVAISSRGLLKEMPPEESSDLYKLGFIRGWFATDGCVSNGAMSICGNGVAIKWLEKWGPVVGFWTQGKTHNNKYIGMYEGGYDLNTDSWNITFSCDSIQPEDLLQTKHKNKYQNKDLGHYRVAKHEHIDITEEEVFCAVVEDGGTFTLNGGLVTRNCKFEERWTMKAFGHRVRNWYWDTVLAAHICDNRRSITSIKFQSFVRLGLPVWNSHIEPYLQANTAREANQILQQVAQRDLLLYNGLDSLVEYKVAMLQMEELNYPKPE